MKNFLIKLLIVTFKKIQQLFQGLHLSVIGSWTLIPKKDNFDPGILKVSSLRFQHVQSRSRRKITSRHLFPILLRQLGFDKEKKSNMVLDLF